MQLRQTNDQIASQLDQALTADLLPAGYRQWGERLLCHLREPVQVVAIGRAGSAKSSLINMILGRAVIAGMEATPEIHVVQGRRERAYVEHFDGRCEWHEGLLSGLPEGSRVARACQELPDDRLALQNYIEIGLPNDPAEARTVVAQAAID